MSDSTLQLTLLGTSACHLCELAEALLARLLVQYQHWQIELIDIADEDALILNYGERIPVLRRESDGTELDWPFDDDGVLAFVDRGRS